MLDLLHNLPQRVRLILEVHEGENISKSSHFVRLNDTSGTSWRLEERVEILGIIEAIEILLIVEQPYGEREVLGLAETFVADLVQQRPESADTETVVQFSPKDGTCSLELSFRCAKILFDGPPEQQISVIEEGTDEDDSEDQMILCSQSEHSTEISSPGRTFVDAEYEIALALSEDDSNKSVKLMDVGDLYIQIYHDSEDTTDIDKAISAQNFALHLPQSGHADKPIYLSKLGESFTLRFDHLEEYSDLSRAISLQEDALRLLPEDHDDRPMYMNVLGTLFTRSFEYTGDIADISRAISIQENAILLTREGHDDRAGFQSNLGISFSCRFERFGDLADIDSAISFQEDALRVTPNGHAERYNYQSNLGNSFQARFEQTGALTDIKRALSLHQDSVQTVSDEHPNKPALLNNLGNSFLLCFRHTGTIDYLDGAITAQEAALRLVLDGYSERLMYLTNLGLSLTYRFERGGSLVDINKAISIQEDVLRLTPAEYAERFTILNNLSDSLARRFEQTGSLADIIRAISVQENAIEIIPELHTDKPTYLSNLGGSFTQRYEYTGILADIDRAISLQEDALYLIPDGHATKPVYLSNFGGSLTRRFERTGALVDIDRAISVQEDAIRLRLEEHADKPRQFYNLGISFSRRFERTGDLLDINKAISCYKDAIRLAGEKQADKPSHLNGLGNAFAHRFEHTRDKGDIDSAISVQKNAILITSDGHASKPMYLNNLGDSFQTRFRQNGALPDIDAAIRAHEDAVRLTPDEHAYTPTYLNNLGNSFTLRFYHTKDRNDAEKALRHLELSARSLAGPPSLRFRAAMTWARLSQIDGPSRSMEAYRVAFSLIPQVVWLGKTISERHIDLLEIGNFASEAAATAISAMQYKVAVEWLEQGRSIVWGQMLSLRTPVDQLRGVAPRLAGDLERVSAALEYAGHREEEILILPQPSPSPSPSREKFVQIHHRLAEEWDSLLKRCRSIPGFEDFLLPKAFSLLSEASKNGPIAVINVHEHRCDALILMADSVAVTHVPLKEFSYKQAEELQSALGLLLSSARVGARDSRGIGRKSHELKGELQRILAKLWSDIVEPILAALRITVRVYSLTSIFELEIWIQKASHEDDAPRIWWCAAGPLASLPIHAAGLFDENGIGINISDFVTSSYTLTLAALINAPPARHSSLGRPKLLAVGLPETPGQTPLPSTAEELTLLRTYSRNIEVKCLEGEMATVEAVTKEMQDYGWVHFACHAAQDAIRSKETAFRLHDGDLDLSKIIKKSFQHTEFAFLSACQTATGVEALPEEAIHLAGGMLLAGYRSVIATMWSINDEDGPIVASGVYAHLFGGGEPNCTRAAHALRRAVRYLREERMEGRTGNDAFLSWVPFIRFGM